MLEQTQMHLKNIQFVVAAKPHAIIASFENAKHSLHLDKMQQLVDKYSETRESFFDPHKQILQDQAYTNIYYFYKNSVLVNLILYFLLLVTCLLRVLQKNNTRMMIVLLFCTASQNNSKTSPFPRNGKTLSLQRAKNAIMKHKWKRQE